MSSGRYQYSNICSIIREQLVDANIPSDCIEVLYDRFNWTYCVKIKNMMGEAEYQQTQRMIFLYGVTTFTDIIKHDFVVQKGVEE